MTTKRETLALFTALVLGATFASCERTTAPGGAGPIVNRPSLTADRSQADTTPPDTTPPDTVPPDTIPPDTIPPDTIPPDTTPPPQPPPDEGGARVAQSATGSGHLTAAGELRTFAFSAVERADGSVAGQFELFARSAGVRVHGEVVCLQVVGNRAWMGGVIRQTSDPTRAQAGTETGWRVADNGEGRAAPPDQTSLMFVNQPPGFAQSYCRGMSPTPMNPVEKGNIQVRDKGRAGGSIR
ncbi:MAG: hypothetical protein ABR499_02755 [Gemmatimonadaceae bacterium]